MHLQLKGAGWPASRTGPKGSLFEETPEVTQKKKTGTLGNLDNWHVYTQVLKRHAHQAHQFSEEKC